MIDAPELPGELCEFLALPGSHALIVWGPTGTGKSTLAIELLRRLPGTLVLVTPAGIPLDERIDRSRGPDARIVHVTMSARDVARAVSDDLGPGSMLAVGLMGPEPAGERPAWVEEVLRHVRAADRAYVVVDHWRPRAGRVEGRVEDHGAVASGADHEIQSLLSALEGTSTHLVLLADMSPTEEPVSNVDGAIETGFEALPSGRIRVLTLQKLRGVALRTAQYSYSLDDGRFRCAMPLPEAFLPPMGPPDPVPEERPGFIWPGSADFASVFGWLRHGAFTSIGAGNGVPGYLGRTLAMPVVAHALSAGGRVVWVPAAADLPEQLVATLLPWIPRTELIAGLRILSAGGDESHPDLRQILMELPVARGASPSESAQTARRVGPAFTEAYRFLQGTAPGRPTVFVLSLDGLRAVASVTGVQYDPATFPVIVARYGQLPGFHGFAFAQDSDPLAVSAAGQAERLVRADVRHGRVFLSGVRPETLPHALYWTEGDPRYRLFPMT